VTAVASVFRRATSSCLVASGSRCRPSPAKRRLHQHADTCGSLGPAGQDRGEKDFRVGRKNLLWRQEPPPRRHVDSQAPGEAPQPLTLNHPASNPGRVSGRGSSFLEPIALVFAVSGLCAGTARLGCPLKRPVRQQVASSTLRQCVASYAWQVLSVASQGRARGLILMGGARLVYFCLRVECFARPSGLMAIDHQIVAMDHCGSARKAEDGCDVGR
jgi:hypothetical protein